jgi:hypothetical protein
MACLLRIIDILGPYLPTGAESEKVKQALEHARLPEKLVLNWDFRLGADSTGEPAIWVWVFVDPDVAAGEDFNTLASDVQRRVRDSLAEAGIARWAYVRFRTASEQRAL